MADSPSPLALAREAEDMALGHLLNAHFKYGKGQLESNGLEEAMAFNEARRRCREELVRATLLKAGDVLGRRSAHDLSALAENHVSILNEIEADG